MAINRLSHIQLNSDDVETSRVFYENAFGAKVGYTILQKDGNGIKGYIMEIAPGSVLEISTPRFPFNGKNSAWNTIAIETDDINLAIEKVVNAGGIHEVGPSKGTMGTLNMYNAVVIGPSGEHIELIQLI